MDQYNRGRLVEVRLKYFVSLTNFISRIITSDWGLADWVQRLIGTNRVCYASEKSMVDPKNRLMEMHSKNLTFNSYVNMEEKMTYTADPEDNSRTMCKQEMIVTVQGVPLTSYMEGIIVNTVSNNSSKGKAAIEWVVEKLGQECRLVNNIVGEHTAVCYFLSRPAS